MNFSSHVSRWHDRCDATLGQWLEDGENAPRLLEAMRYSLFNGGKRLRPVLVYAACQALQGRDEQADNAAAAVECIHAYSLIHDDLPAMDDDDLRRGKPTCHIAFDEATAILAGDALQALAFEILVAETGFNAGQLATMVRTLAEASGHRGMVAGQSVDMEAEGKQLDVEQLQQMHSMKTGALISASVRLGAHASGNASAAELDALAAYASAVGLAFQIQDDILDIESSTEVLGKPQGADMARNKSTYPALLGLDAAKARARALQQQAIDALTPFGDAAQPLRQLADYIIQRNH